MKDQKKAHWKTIKKEWIEIIPDRFKVGVNGIEQEESKYYHPVIFLDEDFYIHTQCDLDTNRVYGYSLKPIKESIYNQEYITPYIDINDTEELKYILNNYDSVRTKLDLALTEILKLKTLIKDIEVIQNEIIYESVNKIIDKSRLKKSIDKLYEVSEYLENKRAIL